MQEKKIFLYNDEVFLKFLGYENIFSFGKNIFICCEINFNENIRKYLFLCSIYVNNLLIIKINYNVYENINAVFIFHYLKMYYLKK